jgi:hypothetical protein
MVRVGIAGVEKFCAEVGIGKPTYYRLVNDPDRSRRATQETVALRLKFREWSDLLLAWQNDDVLHGLATNNVDHHAGPGEPPIPTWDLPLAANRWAEPESIGELDPRANARAIDRGVFRVRIHGPCMEPAWPDGSFVEFRIIRMDGRDRIAPTMDVYVQRSDGAATFKRIHAVHEDHLVLRAINTEFPALMRVPWQEVARLAEATGTFIPRRL